MPEPTAVPTPVPTPIVTDAPIQGPASGTIQQALAWLVPRADPGYTEYDIATNILPYYQQVGESVGMDWFLAIAQMAHETGSLTSFWSMRPQRNPVGIGVTGEAQLEQPIDITGWAYNYQRGRWEKGNSFSSWAEESVPAHLGRLLAYALTDVQANPTQLALITKALSYRPLPLSYRGAAPTITGLNGRWAVPGTIYGQTIMALADKMRAL